MLTQSIEVPLLYPMVLLLAPSKRATLSHRILPLHRGAHRRLLVTQDMLPLWQQLNINLILRRNNLKLRTLPPDFRRLRLKNFNMLKYSSVINISTM